MQGLEIDMVFAEQSFIMPEPIQELALWKAAPARTWAQGVHALSPSADAGGAGEFAVALGFALVALHAREESLRLHGRRL